MAGVLVVALVSGAHSNIRQRDPRLFVAKMEKIMSVFKGDKGGVKAPAQSSAQQNTAVGSGSKVTPSRFEIETSAPMNAHTLDRNPPSPLK